ncbi:radical SAM domain protein [Chitinispirillum alkaliphilum]|nr:radical SAM domain protein [Chitinispirillum alkaliphilum]
MNTHDKLKILSDASRFDLSCACGSKEQDGRVRGRDGTWVYPASLPGGGNSVMLKSLMSTVCVSDCKYCPYRSESDVPRYTLGPDEMASSFMEFVRKKRVFGLFLSSGIIGTPDRTMECLNATARILRKKYEYRGYIHLKIIPGASDGAIDEALSLSNGVSLNIEAPGEKNFAKLSTSKNYLDHIIRPMKRIGELTARGMKYSRVKQTTQFIVGAAGESDAEIIRYTAGLYKKLNLNRVYFSAYQRGLGDRGIPGEQQVGFGDQAFVREHRLYQTDFLLRKYGFSDHEILFDTAGRLFYDKDPKLAWAQANPQFFPLNINRCTKSELLRVPGIGPLTAKRIIAMRKNGRIHTLDTIGARGSKRMELARKYLRV